MSLIIGLLDITGTPIQPQDLAPLYNGVQHFPHEKYEKCRHLQVGFGQLLTFKTPEAVHEKQPYLSLDKNYLFVAQRRLDNREELAQARH